MSAYCFYTSQIYFISVQLQLDANDVDAKVQNRFWKHQQQRVGSMEIIGKTRKQLLHCPAAGSFATQILTNLIATWMERYCFVQQSKLPESGYSKMCKLATFRYSICVEISKKCTNEDVSYGRIHVFNYILFGSRHV